MLMEKMVFGGTEEVADDRKCTLKYCLDEHYYLSTDSKFERDVRFDWYRSHVDSKTLQEYYSPRSSVFTLWSLLCPFFCGVNNSSKSLRLLGSNISRNQTFNKGDKLSRQTSIRGRMSLSENAYRIFLWLLLWFGSVAHVLAHEVAHSMPSLSSTVNISPSEWNALFDLYNATNGAHWLWSDDPTTGIPWNFSDPLVNNPCVDDWQGIDCSYNTSVGCFHVISVDLAFRNLQGTLPASLSALSELQILYLQYNGLVSTIPTTLGNLSQLQRLYLYFNRLSGALPNSLSALSNLQYLQLYSNRLTGTVPTSFGNLTQLKVLNFNSNRLNGSIPSSLGALPCLQYLYFDSNVLTGTIPTTLGHLTQLQELYIDLNHLTGSIPHSLGNLTELQVLALYGNKLNGSMPASVGNLTQLQYLAMYDNQLSGSIPASIGNLRQLLGLFLYNNRLTGSIPSSLVDLAQLQYLVLYNNRISGRIPPSMGDLSQLQDIVLYNNHITGTIPVSLGNLTELQYLVLYANKFSGSIPASLGNLAQLQYLLLYDNKLTGSIPVTLGDITQLRILDLDTNRLTGRIPDTLCHLIRLGELSLYSNRLTGTIPASLGKLVNLQCVDLSANQLSSSIPPSLSNLTELQYLDVDSNHLTGTIPTLLRLSNLFSYLRLSDNLLSGTVPMLTFSPNLEIVQLQHNYLTGNLDHVFDPTTQFHVATLVLNNNQLTGTIPSDIFKLRLRTFSSIDNCFIGPLPTPSICGNLNMVDFIVDGMSSATSCRNKLFFSAYTLQHAIGGTIPSCLFRLPNITTLHLSGNGFTGSIPNDIQLSSNLTDLSLSHNALTGSIPEQIQLRRWANIDLSYNRLSGTLLSNFAANKSVELDNNRVSGTIPSVVQSLVNISILGSNTFACSFSQSDLPQHDDGKDRYHCGSNSFDIMYYIWLGVFVSTSGVLCYLQWRYRLVESFRNNDIVLRDTHLYKTLSFVSRVTVQCALYSILVLLPLYAICGVFYGTQTHQYAYQVSSVFKSGTVPFALNWVLWSIVVLFMAVAVHLSFIGREREHTVHPARGKVATHRAIFFTFVPYLLINCIVVIGVNAAYVYVAVYRSSWLLLLVQTLLSVFKLWWGRWALPYILTVLTKRTKYGNLQVVTQIIVNILNYIAIPCMVVAVVSPNCFYYALVAAPPVVSTAVSAECAIFTASRECLQYEYTYVPTSYHPPFTYNYQCSASLITYYAPAFVSMCIMSTFVTPLAQSVCQWLYLRAAPGTSMHRLWDYSLSRIMKPNNTACSADMDGKCFIDSGKLMTTLISTLGIMSTFGIMFPPLCAALAVSILTTMYFFRVSVSSFIRHATQQGSGSIVEMLQAECNSVDSMYLLKDSVWVLITASCWFYTLFLFDTLGDAVGFEGAYWVLIVMPLMPLTMYIVYALVSYLKNDSYQKRDHATGEDSATEMQVMKVNGDSIVHNALLETTSKDVA